MLAVSVVVAMLLVPIFALSAKVLYASILVVEAQTALEASATSAFPCLSAARLAGMVGELEMNVFREMLSIEIDRNTASGPLAGCVTEVGAMLEEDGRVTCTLRYRTGNLRQGIFGELVPESAMAVCRVDLPVEP